MFEYRRLRSAGLNKSGGGGTKNGISQSGGDMSTLSLVDVTPMVWSDLPQHDSKYVLSLQCPHLNIIS